jgi:hypothetical protein
MRTRGQTIDGLVPAELHLGLVRLRSGTTMGASVDSEPGIARPNPRARSTPSQERQSSRASRIRQIEKLIPESSHMRI